MLKIEDLKIGEYLVVTYDTNIGTKENVNVVKGQWLSITEINFFICTMNLVTLDGKPVSNTGLNSRYRLPYKNEVMK